TSPSSPCRIGRSQSRKTTSPRGRAAARPAGASGTRNRGGSSTMHRPTNSPRIFEPTGSLDRERFFRQAFRRGDELRNPLFRIGQDRMAAPEEGQALLEHREGAIEGQIPARERLDLLLEGLHRLLEGRLRRHRDAPSSWTCTWTRPSWNRTARASPSSISEARETTWPSIRSAIA